MFTTRLNLMGLYFLFYVYVCMLVCMYACVLDLHMLYLSMIISMIDHCDSPAVGNDVIVDDDDFDVEHETFVEGAVAISKVWLIRSRTVLLLIIQ